MQYEITTGWLNVNTGCQNRCASCYRMDDLVVHARSMPLPRAQRVVALFSELGIYSCIFIGGEPTLYRNLPILIRQAKSGGIPEVTVVSNGRLLRDAELAAAYADAGLDVFSITIHSALEEVHDRITKRPSWKETVAGIENAVSTGVKTSLNVVAGPENTEYIEQSIEPLLRLGVAEIVVSCAIPRLCDNGFDGTNSLDPKRFAALVESLRGCPGNVVILHELPLCLLQRDLFLDLVQNNRLGFGCHIGTGRGISVDVDGRTIPCNSFPNMDVLELFEGDTMRLPADALKARWDHDGGLQAIREAANVYRSPICERCGLWDFCNCGCPLTWGCYTPSDYINDGLVGVDPMYVAELSRIRFNP